VLLHVVRQSIRDWSNRVHGIKGIDTKGGLDKCCGIVDSETFEIKLNLPVW